MFTITDGAIRMLVVLYFHLLGYSPLQVAMLFVFYEFFGIVTNLVGGWLGSRIGLNKTMHMGMALQILALLLLTVPEPMLSVAWVMFAQALSGIAKDLNKMSAKASVKTLTTAGEDEKLFKWVAVLTGSKNTLKGAGFFVGAVLLQWLGFQGALWVLATALAVVLVVTFSLLPNELGKSKHKHKFSQVFSNTAAINWLSAARFFLFGARDIWFVVALPVFLYDVLGWSFSSVGAFIASWVIAYGLVQASAPKLLKRLHRIPGGGAARGWAAILALIPAGMVGALSLWPAEPVVVIGLITFGVVFAINSAIHSFLILAYADADTVALNVGFYYMANAAGRLAGTLLSGWAYQIGGLSACLWWSSGFIVAAFLLSLRLPEAHRVPSTTL